MTAPDRSGAADDGPTDAREVLLRIPAKPEYITLCRLALTGIARMRPLGDETLADLKLALTEACSNSVRHAYAGGDGAVDIRYVLHADRLVIEVADDGEGFDPALSPGDAEDELAEGGLGIAIIRSIADALEIRTGENGRGSLLRFEKILTG